MKRALSRGDGLFRAVATRPERFRPRWLVAVVPVALIGLIAVAQPALAASSSTVSSAASTTTVSSPANPTATAPTASGTVNQKIADIALSQVGVGDSPIATSFSGLNCNPYTTEVAGFSANSNGCGSNSALGVRNSNENWCSDFVKWVWQRAGVTQDMNTLNAAASSFYSWALADGQNPEPDAGTPQVGDAVVFFGAGAISPTTYADHVGTIVGVNPDGTVDMVNGDFLGATNISVEHDTDLNLTSFAASTWGAGEQWVLVAPPTTAQKPSPAASISGPATAVTGTEAAFRVDASERGGSVTADYWTFGDGRATNATGRQVTHVFSTPGTYTITATATSNFGTITTERKNVTVVAASGSVAAVPSTATWYSSYPVSYYRFLPSSGNLAADAWDGASWLQVAAAGAPAAGGSIAALAYPDDAAGSATTPHAFFRAADGSLAETYLNGSAWVSTDLPGEPAAGADIVAAATPSGPAVFFVDAHGRMTETTQRSGEWTTRTLPAPASHAAPLALAETASGPTVFAVADNGALTATSQFGAAWSTTRLPASAAPHATLSAVTTPAGAASVVVNGADAANRHHGSALTQLTQGLRGAWRAVALPGSPAAGTPISATNYLVPAAASGALGAFPQPPGSLTASAPQHPLATVVAYATAAGTPAVTYGGSASWQTATLPGSAATVAGISAFPVAHQPIQVYLNTSSGPAMDTTGDTAPPSGPWATQPLPDAPATFADRVLLYAAGTGDQAAASAAATAAGLPASQVTTSFATAWAATLSGQRLVITVGQGATNALEYNECGWANPSAVDAGSTPFDYVTAARTTLPGAELFLNGAAATASQDQQRASDLAYYATHGALPAGQTTVPTAARAARACLGSAS